MANVTIKITLINIFFKIVIPPILAPEYIGNVKKMQHFMVKTDILGVAYMFKEMSSFANANLIILKLLILMGGLKCPIQIGSAPLYNNFFHLQYI